MHVRAQTIIVVTYTMWDTYKQMPEKSSTCMCRRLIQIQRGTHNYM
jgi:hypothetical protein